MAASSRVAGTARAKRRRFDLSARILIGIAAGVVVGLFIGERAAGLQILADAYVKLLQMTVLPYVTMSLVGGLGGLSAADARRLGLRVGGVLIALWIVALLAVFSFPLLFPRTEAASFFSTTLLDDGAPFDLVGLYIPANPFSSLANNVVPAVVLFSALVGVALIGIPGKERALETIDVVNRAVARVASFIVSLTPYGLFAIAAVTAGTFDPHQAAQVEIYLITFASVSLLLAFWVLPGLIAAVTPVPHGAVLARNRDALVMAFSTGSLFLVLPLLTEQTRQMVREYAAVGAGDERLPDVIVPASFNFPHTAKLLSLSFVLFAGWFTGATIPADRYPALAATGLMVLFGNTSVAVPFLLDMFRIPADTFQLFLTTGVVNSRFGTVLSAVHTIAIALIGTFAVAGGLRLEVRRLLRYGALTAVVSLATLGGTRMLVARLAGDTYDRDRVLAGMQALRHRGDFTVLRGAPPSLPTSVTLIDRIRDRKTIRVGYLDGSLPFVYTNTRDDLVGFDVEMAQQLAHDVGAELELVPVSRTMFEEGLDPSLCDLVMSGTAVTAERAARVRFSTPYLDETVAFVVPDHRRAAFASWDAVRALGRLHLGVPSAPYYLRKVREELPDAEIVPIVSADALFKDGSQLDAIVLTAERGSAYTLLHPEYSVVVPRPGLVKVPLAYVIAGRDEALGRVVDTWIDLKKKDGTIDELFSHWILGRDQSRRARRWSVLDDVLGWRK